MNAPMVNVESTKAGKGKKSLDIPLVDGELDADDSREYLLQLIDDLRGYHQRRNFSHQECFGAPDPLSEKALDELSTAFENARFLVEHAHDSQLRLVIESSIRVKLAPQRDA